MFKQYLLRLCLCLLLFILSLSTTEKIAYVFFKCPIGYYIEKIPLNLLQAKQLQQFQVVLV